MFLRDFIKESIASLERLYPAPEARNIVMLLCQALLGVKSYTHITEPQTVIPPSSQPALDSAMERLLSAEPLQYVLGSASFYGREFRVTPAVLIPRPETELLVSLALSRLRALSSESSLPAHFRLGGSPSESSSAHTLLSDSLSESPSCTNPHIRNISSLALSPETSPAHTLLGGPPSGFRVLDLCTGSGCVAWTIALEIPGTEVLALDISDSALEIAKSQAFQTPVPPQFLKDDILDSEQAFDHGRFDLILCNPPYIMNKEKPFMRSNVLKYEPGLALFVDDSDPLIFYRAAARWAQRFLVPGGAAFFEINEQLGEQTAESILSFGFLNLQIHRDFAEKNRIVSFSKPF